MDFRVCRVCLGRKNQSECRYLNNSTKEKLGECVPEMNLDINENPALCFDCEKELMITHSFRMKCISTEQALDKYMNSLRDPDVKGKINLDEMLEEINCLKINLKQNIDKDNMQAKNEGTNDFSVMNKCDFNGGKNTIIESGVLSNNNVKCLKEDVNGKSNFNSEISNDSGKSSDNFISNGIYEVKNDKNKSIAECSMNLSIEHLGKEFLSNPKIDSLETAGIKNVLCTVNDCGLSSSKIIDEKCVSNVLETNVSSNANEENCASIIIREECSLITIKKNSALEIREEICSLELIENKSVNDKTNQISSSTKMVEKDCSVNEKDLKSVKRKVNNVMDKNSIKDGSSKKSKTENTDSFLCSSCGMCYKTKSQLRFHMRKHEDVLRHACDICDEKFRHLSSLKVHRRTHAKDITDEKFLDEIFRCDICSRHFYDKTYLHKHMKKHGKPEFSCEWCKRNFYNKGDLGKHQRIHTGEKPYECKLCGMKFRVSASYIRHTRAHTGEKPYVCETCGKCFNQKYNLTSHMALHSDVKQYNCDSCTKCFRHKATRDMHVLRLHAKGRKLKCQVCFLCFSNEENLKGHGCRSSTQVSGD